MRLLREESKLTATFVTLLELVYTKRILREEDEFLTGAVRELLHKHPPSRKQVYLMDILFTDLIRVGGKGNGLFLISPFRQGRKGSCPISVCIFNIKN